REEKERELQNLLHSGMVREKTQLHSLLEYLGTRAIETPEEALKEYTIGVEALGKPADYDPRLDPTIRVEVAKLRKKLTEHYQGAGAGHPVRLEIPKGHYLPIFVVAPPAEKSLPRRIIQRWWVLALAGIVLAAAIVTPWLVERRSRPRLAPELETFWAPHFDGTPTLLILGAPLFFRTGTSFYRNTRVNQPEDVEKNDVTRKVFAALEPQQPRSLYHFVGTGEAEALFQLTRLLAARRATLVVRRSDVVGWNDLKGRHVIFLGGRKFNPQIPELPYKPKFEAAERRIVNLDPRPGEPAAYVAPSPPTNPEIAERYALISVYPGFSQHTRLVTLECSSTEGTLAAAEFLTRPDMLAQLLARGIPLKAEKGVFRPYQVVIGAKLNKGVVVGLFYKTHRLL
ncbi:MAG: hypothetical protein Q8N47_03570, partial [Bryobacterales bacterium]|nr:hypothetical protein [Bryobacterales bacterium]